MGVVTDGEWGPWGTDWGMGGRHFFSSDRPRRGRAAA